MTISAAHNKMITQIILPGVVAPSGLQVQHVGGSDPAAGQMLLRMEASGVSFAEKAMRRGRYPGQPKFPFVPGYDVVGTVLAVGPGGDSSMIGRRVGAAIKTGGWATQVLVPADEIVVVPDGVAATDAETVIVNGVTAWQMLFSKAQAKRGQTILVLGASSGVGTILAQLAIAEGIRVIGTASPRQHSALRTLGVEPIDYADPDVAARVRELSPRGVDAVFDHLGPSSVKQSFALLDDGGILVVYGIAADLDNTTALAPRFLGLLATLALWSALPNGKRALFYDFWEGMIVGSTAAKRRRRADLAKVLGRLAGGVVKPMIAATYPLGEAAAAMERSEARGLFGKVVIVP